MNTYLVEYNSEGNLFEGKLVVRAPNIALVQDTFFEWLKKQPTYNHLWQLSFSIEVVGECNE